MKLTLNGDVLSYKSILLLGWKIKLPCTLKTPVGCHQKKSSFAYQNKIKPFQRKKIYKLNAPFSYPVHKAVAEDTAPECCFSFATVLANVVCCPLYCLTCEECEVQHSESQHSLLHQTCLQYCPLCQNIRCPLCWDFRIS